MIDFSQNDYAIIRKFIDVDGIGDYILSLNDRGRSFDSQVPNTPCYYNDPMLCEIHERVRCGVEGVVGKSLLRTYTYCRIYKRGDILKAHTDREACEYSVTFHIYGDADWPLFVLDKNEWPVMAMLGPGDALFYKGRERTHWRPRFDGSVYLQAFLHYVDRNGPFRNHEGDRVATPHARPK